MKRINNSDINFLLNPKTVNLSNFSVRFYTVNLENFFIRKSQDDVKTVEVETEDGETSVNYYLKLDWSELVTLGEGVLQYQLLNNYQDSDRPDNYYNQNIERTTQYYIDSNITVDEDEAESYAEIIAELGDKIDGEIARSTSADTLQTEALNSEIQIRQGQINDILDIIDVISGETDLSNYYTKDETYNRNEVDAKIEDIDVSEQLKDYLKISSFTESEQVLSGAIDTNKSDISTLANQITNEVTNRENADSELSNKIDAKLDISAYTPTDLSNYYTKSEVYNKTEIDNKGYLTEHQDISGKLNISDFNVYSADTKTIIDSKVDSTDLDDFASKEFVSGFTYNKTATDELLSAKLDTTAYTPTDLTNYYTKSEIDSKGYITDVSNKLNISDFNTYSANTDNLLSRYHESTVIADQTAICANTTANEAKNIANITFNSLTQSDWNESDASSLSYIENKPFGETSGFVNIFANTSFSLTRCGQYNYGNLNGGLSLSEDLVDGEVYKVTVNGNDFVYTASTYNNILCLNFSGNPNVDTVTVFKSNLNSGYNISIYETYLNSDTSHAAISISKNGYQLVQIDNKYINYSGDTYIQSLVTRIDNKQNELVSGENIKTINNQSLLGSGNITIQGGEGSSGFIQVTNPDTAETKVGLVNSLSQYYDTNIGKGAVIEGDGYENNVTTYNIVASGGYSHAEGYYTKAIGSSSHAEGNGTIASGSSSHAEGSNTTANGNYAHAEDYNTKANGDYSHAEGNNTTASGSSSHAEGENTIANGNYSHAEGSFTTASGSASHAEGYYTKAIGNYAHTEGYYSQASGDYSHAEGQNTLASGSSSHAEGQNTVASGFCSHAEGAYGIQANGDFSHAEGCNGVIANGEASHAEGCFGTAANGEASHAEGKYGVTANGEASHAEGYGTIANNTAEHASGRYNVSSSASTTFGDSGNTLFSVGNGTYQNKHNAFEIRQNGDIYITSGSTDIKLQDHLGGGGGSSTPIVILTESEYQNLTTKDENTVYIIK